MLWWLTPLLILAAVATAGLWWLLARFQIVAVPIPRDRGAIRGLYCHLYAEGGDAFYTVWPADPDESEAFYERILEGVMQMGNEEDAGELTDPESPDQPEWEHS